MSDCQNMIVVIVDYLKNNYNDSDFRFGIGEKGRLRRSKIRQQKHILPGKTFNLIDLLKILRK